MSPPKYDLWQEILRIRRQSQELNERWAAIGTNLMSEGQVIGRMNTPQRAELVSTCHNTWLTIMNSLISSQRRLRDRNGVRTVQQQDRKEKAK